MSATTWNRRSARVGGSGRSRRSTGSATKSASDNIVALIAELLSRTRDVFPWLNRSWAVNGPIGHFAAWAGFAYVLAHERSRGWGRRRAPKSDRRTRRAPRGAAARAPGASVRFRTGRPFGACRNQALEAGRRNRLCG